MEVTLAEFTEVGLLPVRLYFPSEFWADGGHERCLGYIMELYLEPTEILLISVTQWTDKVRTKLFLLAAPL